MTDWWLATRRFDVIEIEGVLDELRAAGVRYGLVAELGVRMDVTPELSPKVIEILERAGMRELREGLWGRANLTDDAIRRWEKIKRSDDEYRDIYRTMTEHPEWSDEEVAAATGADVRDVADYRAEWDR